MPAFAGHLFFGCAALCLSGFAVPDPAGHGLAIRSANVIQILAKVLKPIRN
jgi:hypothetical protein